MTAATAEALTIGSLGVVTLVGLSRRRDPVGVLSIYLDAQPGHRLRATSSEIKNHLSDLERRLKTDGPPARARTVDDGVARLRA